MLRSCILLLACPSLLFAGGTGEAVRRETTPTGLTLYLPIDLGVPRVPESATGVFIPTPYRTDDTIDLLLFLRGYDVHRPKTATSVGEYWNSPRHPVLKSFLLREEVQRSGKNVILVVPALGPFAEPGKLKEKGGVQAFLRQIVDGLCHSGPHAGRAKRPAIRHLILAAHSGGGTALCQVAQVLGGDKQFKDKVKACWGFDSIYGVKAKDAEFWADWAKEHPGADIALFYIYTDRAAGKDRRAPTGTTGPALELERLAKTRKLTNVRVVRETKVSHTDVPRSRLAELLRSARWLDDRDR